MRMNVTPAGIDWHRLTEDQVAEVGARIVSAATGCSGVTYDRTGAPWRNPTRIVCELEHFTDQAGREVCPRAALKALEVEAEAGTFADVLPKARRITAA